ncbi:hypothetical protein V8F33_008268 [Rhypophila sp. PSN 637]
MTSSSLAMANDQNSDEGCKALMWLVAAQRPVTAVELYAIILIGRGQDNAFRAAGSFMTTQARNTADLFTEEKAISEIQALLGRKAVEFIREPGFGHHFCVRLALRYQETDGHSDNLFRLVPHIDFTKEEAHKYAASICLGICRTTTPRLANFRGDTPALFSLLTYAWTNWSLHIYLSSSQAWTSGLQLRNTFNNVVLDALNYLVTLDKQLLQCANSANKKGAGELALLSAEALELLEVPLGCLSDMVRAFTQESSLHILDILLAATIKVAFLGDARPFPTLHSHITQTSDGLVAMSTRHCHKTVHAKRNTSRIGGMNTDVFLFAVKWQKRLQDQDKEFLALLAESARHLRLLCITLSQGPLVQKLATEGSGSTFDTLLNLANFLEALSCVPFRSLMQKSYSEEHLELSRSESGECRARYHAWEDQEAEKLFIEHQSLPCLDEGLMRGVNSSDTVIRLTNAQVAILRMKRPFTARGQNDNSQWARAAKTEEDASPALVLAVLHRTHPGGLAYVEDINWIYLQLKSILLSDGYPPALARILVAIVINHIRTILVPWLGVDTWQNPLEQLRLSLSNPEVFLDEFHSYTWVWMAFSTFQRVALGFVAGQILEGALTSVSPTKLLPGFRHSQFYIVCYMVWVLTTAEYLFSHTINLFAVATAFWNLASSESEAGLSALRMVMAKRWPKMIPTAAQMLYLIRFTALPIVTLGVRTALNGHLGLSLFIGLVVVLARAIIVHRSFFFIALQMSGMFVAAGWFLVACWVLCEWFWDDPLGVKLHVERAVRREEVTQAVLARGLAHREEHRRSYWY